jgi:hypothetical protein
MLQKEISMPYDITIVTTHPGTQSKARPKLEAWVSTAKAGGTLLALWHSEMGALNQNLILRHYDDEARMTADRAAFLVADDPFGIAEFTAGIAMDTYLPLPFMAALKPGNAGPFFEVRTYTLKPDGLPKITASWEARLEHRVKVSPLLAALRSVSGSVTRCIQIWPYPTLEARMKARGDAVATGQWPPPGGTAVIAAQQSDIYLPAASSPIR